MQLALERDDQTPRDRRGDGLVVPSLQGMMELDRKRSTLVCRMKRKTVAMGAGCTYGAIVRTVRSHSLSCCSVDDMASFDGDLNDCWILR